MIIITIVETFCNSRPRKKESRAIPNHQHPWAGVISGDRGSCPELRHLQSQTTERSPGDHDFMWRETGLWGLCCLHHLLSPKASVAPPDGDSHCTINCQDWDLWFGRFFWFPCALHPVMLKLVALLHVPTVGAIIARRPAINLPQSEREGVSGWVSCDRADGLLRSSRSARDVCS